MTRAAAPERSLWASGFDPFEGKQWSKAETLTLILSLREKKTLVRA